MEAEKDLRNQLIRQAGNGAGRPGLTDATVEREMVRVNRLRKLTMISWTVFCVLLVLLLTVRVCWHTSQTVCKSLETIAAYLPDLPYFPIAILVVQAVLIVSSILSVILYARSRSLTINQILARLAGIEEQLRQVADRDKGIIEP